MKTSTITTFLNTLGIHHRQFIPLRGWLSCRILVECWWLSVMMPLAKIRRRISSEKSVAKVRVPLLVVSPWRKRKVQRLFKALVAEYPSSQCLQAGLRIHSQRSDTPSPITAWWYWWKTWMNYQARPEPRRLTCHGYVNQWEQHDPATWRHYRI